jgi:transcriptional antiterminator RfaH
MLEQPSYFAACRTQSQREAFAAGHLEARGFEVFLPRNETRRAVQPLFLGYIFVRIVDRWRAIERTFGVLGLIKFGETPARVPDREIEALRARMNANGIIALPPEPPAYKFRKGDKVRVNAFGTSFDAIHSGTSLRDRERILMTVLGSVRTVDVAKHLVRAAP